VTKAKYFQGVIDACREAGIPIWKVQLFHARQMKGARYTPPEASHAIGSSHGLGTGPGWDHVLRSTESDISAPDRWA
jgi:hypothetical protein